MIWTTTPLDQRRAYALVRVGRLLQDYDLDRKRLAGIGWAKAEVEPLS